MLATLARTAALSAALMASAVHAAGVASVSPQGEVAQVRQIVVRFDTAVLPFGELRLPDPMAVVCQGGPAAGSGRWADDRTWLFDFDAPLPPATRCTLTARAQWKPAQGAWTGRTEFGFNTGGPAVTRVEPYEGSTVEEDQHFLLHLNGPVVDASVAGHAWCEAEGIGERMAVRVVSGAPRDELIKSRKLERLTPRLLLLACQRPLPSDTRMRLVWGAGIAAQANPKITTRVPQRFDFQVRKAFTAEFSCERERANAPCLPVRPLTLRFSEPVSRSAAQQVRLKPASGAALAPLFDSDGTTSEISALSFPRPLPENASFTIELPQDLKDASGRALANAASFPLKVATGEAPPIAKFGAAPFGVVERNAGSMLPVTLRKVQPDLQPAAATGQVRIKHVDSAAQILAWFARLQRYHESRITAREAGLPRSEWTEIKDETDGRGRSVRRQVDRFVGTRELSLLQGDTGAKRLDLPQLLGGDPRPFEVVGIPITEPGYHVVEIESARLGEALLERRAPMFVRTGVLVTNLGVHFKHGRENSLVWVTTLDRGAPVAGAEVSVHDCRGKALWSGSTDAAGLARVAQALPSDTRGCVVDEGLFVTARKADAGGVDSAFVFSNWQQGIEGWRFGVPTGTGAEPELRAHTVFDRQLLRAGESVSMKHFVRLETLQGLAMLTPDALPTALKIVHQGSGQEFSQALQWHAGRSAASTWAIPPAARLGLYRVLLERDSADPAQRRQWPSGEFRVEQFRVPLVDARVVPPQAVPVAPQELAFGVQMNHLSGGAMAQAPLSASALLTPRVPRFAGFHEFSFEPPRQGGPDAQAPPPDDSQGASRREGRLVADKLPLLTGADGTARLLLKDLPRITRPSELLAEVSFNDPNGELQTVGTTVPLWPSAVVLGLKTGSWISRSGQVAFSVLALDTAGRPIKGQAVEVRGRLAQVTSTRKRMVGGFYAYDNRTELKELGALCSGNTDAHGLLRCEARLASAGEVELVAQAQDAAGHAAQAAASVWVTRQGELWFAQDNDDRIDVLPEKRRYEPGETARLQVRMPFREATALLTVEREGVIESRVLRLRGDDPTVELKIQKDWGPNVYVSVFVVRGRIRDLPWTSFFRWGWKEPLNWARSFWYEGREYQAPTARVDLSKPAFKLGVAALQVGIAAHELQVKVTADKAQYGIRQKALVRISVTQGGKPAAGAEVAFAAVDEGLLALRDNASWDLLNAMHRERAWGVQTSTAQGEIIGRRHFGRKALAPGGGGGRGGTRELFDTLALWQARLVLDARGEATLDVPLNDSLTSFRLVAVADDGASSFGTGSTRIRVTQDLQLLPGLPPLVREGDSFQALLTLRNTTAREMKLRAALAGTLHNAPGVNLERAPLVLPPQELVLAAGSAREIGWAVQVPAEVSGIAWQAAVDELGSAPAKDRVKIEQRVLPAVPVRVLQATLQQLDGDFSFAVAAPADALPLQGAKRGGLNVAVQPRLGAALPGLRRFFDAYPFTCLEQLASRAMGLRDAASWAALTEVLPTYLDSDGLAGYFPPRADEAARGSDRLTAYLLAATHEAGFELPRAERDAMLDGLTAFVQGRIERSFWSPESARSMDLDVRKLAAIEALARHGRAQPKMLGSLDLTPNLWPTAALIDWLSILKRLEGVAERGPRLQQAQQMLRARLVFAGTTLRFSTENSDFWWWLMDSPDANAARLILAVLDDAEWRAELPRLVVGSLGRQQRGAWLTTTANLWGSLALDKFSARFETVAVAGRTVASTGGAAQAIDWSRTAEGGQMLLPWPDAAGTLSVTQQGTGKPWLSVHSLAAIPLKAPLRAGYSLVRSVTAVVQKDPAKWSRGDVLRIRLEVDAQADMSWVVVSDPVPAGASVLGSGLGRDSAIATRTERREGSAWLAFEERSFEAMRSYFEFMPRGRHVVEYSLRLNNPGRFVLPPTRVEAMYAPQSFGELPNAPLEVAP